VEDGGDVEDYKEFEFEDSVDVDVIDNMKRYKFTVGDWINLEPITELSQGKTNMEKCKQ
jgi:hypothetical protein